MPKPLLILDFDNGTSTILSDSEFREDCESGRIRVRPIRLDGTLTDFKEAINDALLLAREGIVRTVAWDSFTFSMKPLMQSALEQAGVPRLDEDMTFVDMRQVVGNINRAAEFFLANLVHINAHLVVTAHEDVRDEVRSQINPRTRQAEQVPTGKQVVVPMAYGQLRNKLSSYFDEVWRMIRRPKGQGAEYVIRVQEVRKEFEGFGSRAGLQGDLEADFGVIMAAYLKGGGSQQSYDAYMHELDTPTQPTTT